MAIKTINKKSDIENPIDRYYEQLECYLKVIENNELMYKHIENYLHKTHAPTHCTYKMKIVNIYEVDKESDKTKFKKDVGNRYLSCSMFVFVLLDFNSTYFRMLLWHGSRSTNWAGILTSGLRIAPPEAPVTGYMVFEKLNFIIKPLAFN